MRTALDEIQKTVDKKEQKNSKVKDNYLKNTFVLFENK